MDDSKYLLSQREDAASAAWLNIEHGPTADGMPIDFSKVRLPRICDESKCVVCDRAPMERSIYCQEHQNRVDDFGGAA